jgi:hypothetical protein
VAAGIDDAHNEGQSPSRQPALRAQKRLGTAPTGTTRRHTTGPATAACHPLRPAPAPGDTQGVVLPGRPCPYGQDAQADALASKACLLRPCCGRPRCTSKRWSPTKPARATIAKIISASRASPARQNEIHDVVGFICRAPAPPELVTTRSYPGRPLEPTGTAASPLPASLTRHARWTARGRVRGTSPGERGGPESAEQSQGEAR